MVTLGDVFLLNFDKRDLILNRTGEISEKQRKRIQNYYRYRTFYYYTPHAPSKRPTTRLYVVLALFTLGPLLFIPIIGATAPLISVISGLVFILGQVANRQSHTYQLINADLQSGEIRITEGVPQVVFDEGNAFIEIDGVRMLASSNLALQFKSEDVYRVYYAPNTKVPLSYERVTIQD
jgi:hypothetical protein